MPLSLTRQFITDTVESRRPYVAMRQIYAPTFVMLVVTLGYITWRWSNFIVWDEASFASYNMFSNNGESNLIDWTSTRKSPIYCQSDCFTPWSVGNPLMSVRAAKQRIKITELSLSEPPRIGGKRKLQMFRWGAAYYFQFWRELWYWKSRKRIV